MQHHETPNLIARREGKFIMDFVILPFTDQENSSSHTAVDQDDVCTIARITQLAVKSKTFMQQLLLHVFFEK
jgi:hypothetical protein